MAETPLPSRDRPILRRTIEADLIRVAYIRGELKTDAEWREAIEEATRRESIDAVLGEA